jgi:hypothetical protein
MLNISCEKLRIAVPVCKYWLKYLDMNCVIHEIKVSLSPTSSSTVQNFRCTNPEHSSHWAHVTILSAKFNLSPAGWSFPQMILGWWQWYLSLFYVQIKVTFIHLIICKYVPVWYFLIYLLLNIFCLPVLTGFQRIFKILNSSVHFVSTSSLVLFPWMIFSLAPVLSSQLCFYLYLW